MARPSNRTLRGVSWNRDSAPPVPAGNLRYWMLGVAAPGEHRWHEQNEAGVVTLEQDGWRIDYQRYSTDPAHACR